MSEKAVLLDKRCFGGRQMAFSHKSAVTICPMEFSVYLPPQAETQVCPVLWFLSGLTCTWKNVTEKGGFQRYCAERGLILVAPDTSPRGDHVADEDSYDLGQGAGFYLNATKAPWSANYQMEDYILKELRQLIEGEFPVRVDRQGVFGHSMGGHGALTFALRFPQMFQSVSAFAPICHPTSVPWGQKAFGHYLGEGKGSKNDATELVRSTDFRGRVLIDQGADDEFLSTQLLPGDLITAAGGSPVEILYREQPGYDHSYYFVSTFIGQHIDWHADQLCPP